MAAPGKRMPVMQMVKSGGNRDRNLRWSDVPEVRESLTFMGKNMNLINLYETKFEMISQETSFNLRLRSLLGAFFICKSLTDLDRNVLFSSMERVLKASDDFLADLEACWQRDIFLTGMFDVVRKHEAGFEAYARHCANQKKVVQHLGKLKSENKEFLGVLAEWENCPENYSKFTLESFLDLPKGRMTCLAQTSENAALLMDKHDPEYKSCQAAIKSTKKMAVKCDQAVATDAQRTKLLKIFEQLSFADKVTPIPIASSTRHLVHVEEVTLLRLSGSNVSKRSQRHVILFNDLVLVTKKAKRDERYAIYDYCQMKNVELKSTDDLLALMKGSAIANSQNKLLLLKFNQNYEKKPVVMLFSCALEAHCDKMHRLLHEYIERSMPPPPVVEVKVDEPELPPLPHRTTMEVQIIEELKRKQEARKRDWVVTHEIVEDEVVDTLGNVRDRRSYAPPTADGKDVIMRDRKPFLIPRPSSSLAHHAGSQEALARSPGRRDSQHLELPVVPAKPRPASQIENLATVLRLEAPMKNEETAERRDSTHLELPAAAKPRSTSQDETRQQPAPTPTPAKKSGIEETVNFDRSIEYPPGMMVFPLVSASRWLVMRGPMVRRWHHEDRKYSDAKVALHVALFNDVLFVTSVAAKKKSDSRYKVLTYGMRNLVDITPVKRLPHLPTKLTADRDNKYVFMITILENHKHVTETLVVSVGSAIERESWLKVQANTTSEPGGDIVYDPWDCPHVVATKPHVPQAQYELAVAVNDKFHVIRSRADGWYEGERVSDGERGFFPSDITVELDSPHKHARDLRQKLKSGENKQ